MVSELRIRFESVPANAEAVKLSRVSKGTNRTANIREDLPLGTELTAAEIIAMLYAFRQTNAATPLN